MGETEILQTAPQNTVYSSSISYYKQGNVVTMPVSITLDKVVNDRTLSVFMNKNAQGEGQTKNFVRFCTNKLFDESELIRSEVAELLGISVPKVFRLTSKVNEEEKQGIYIKCDLETTDTVVSLDQKFSHTSSLVQRGQYSKKDYPEYAIEPNTPENPITDTDTIYQIVTKGVKALPLGEISDSQIGKELISEYASMILLDLISGQVSRNGNEYYYYTRVEDQPDKVDEQGNSIPMPKRKVARIIPGVGHYRYASKDVPEHIYGLNGFYVDRDALLTVLFTNCYAFIEDVVKPLREVSDKYKECLHDIISANTDEKTAADLERIYAANIDKVCEYERAISNAGNKVELVSSTTKLNLNAVTRITTFTEKYKVVEQQEAKKELEGDAHLALKFEEPAKDNSGYVSAILVGTIMAFVCGLGVGIAYILINMP